MADEKISAMTAAAVVASADIVPIVQGGVNKKASRSIYFTAGAGEDIFLTSDTANSAGAISADGNSQIGVTNGAVVIASDGTVNIGAGPGTFDNFLNMTSLGVDFRAKDGQSMTLTNRSATAGQVQLNFSFNALSINGFSSTFVQYVTFSTHWQTINPSDFGAAIDRLAAAVDGLLGGGGVP